MIGNDIMVTGNGPIWGLLTVGSESSARVALWHLTLTPVILVWQKKRRPGAGAQRVTAKYSLENLLDIEAVTAALPVILGMERAVTLDADPAPF